MLEVTYSFGWWKDKQSLSGGQLGNMNEQQKNTRIFPSNVIRDAELHQYFLNKGVFYFKFLFIYF